MLSAYSWNACITPGKIICMTTALSRIVTSAVGGFELCLQKSYRTLHEIRLCPCVRFTIFGKVGDHGWFLCFMKSSRLPLQIWHAIYKWADKLQSCFRADTFSLPLLFIFSLSLLRTLICAWRNSGRLFFDHHYYRFRSFIKSLPDEFVLLAVLRTFLTVSTTAFSIISLVFKTSNSLLSSSKGLPMSSNVFNKYTTSPWKETWTLETF